MFCKNLIFFCKIITLILSVILNIYVNCETSLLSDLISTDPQIVGGEDSPNYPYMASMQREAGEEESGFKHHCGCSILNRYHVLIAAHCVKTYNNDTNLRIKAGIKNLDEPGSVHTVDYFVVHEKYGVGGKHNNDLAIIKITEPFNYTDKIQPVVYTNEYIKRGTPALVTGWGYTANYNYTIPKNLQRVNLTVISNRRCRATFGDRIIDSTLCTKGRGFKTSCMGDSGGPLVRRDDLIQIGIVSFGTDPCSRGRPEAYVRVSSFYHWIKNHSGDEDSSSEEE